MLKYIPYRISLNKVIIILNQATAYYAKKLCVKNNSKLGQRYIYFIIIRKNVYWKIYEWESLIRDVLPEWKIVFLTYLRQEKLKPSHHTL